MCLFLVSISSVKKRRKSSRVSIWVSTEREPQRTAAHSTSSAAANTTTDRSAQAQLPVRSAPITRSPTQSAAQNSSLTCALSGPPEDFICTTRCSKVEQKLLKLVVSTGYMKAQSRQGAVESRPQRSGTDSTGKESTAATAAAQELRMEAGSGRQRSASMQLGRRMSLAAASRSAGVWRQCARAVRVSTACRARNSTISARNSSSTSNVRQYLRFSSLSSVSGEQSNLILTSRGFLTSANSRLVISWRLTASWNSLRRCHSAAWASTWRTTAPITAILRSSSSFSNLKNASSVSRCPRSRSRTATSSHAYSPAHTHSTPSRAKNPERTDYTCAPHTASVSPNFRSYSTTTVRQLSASSLQQAAAVGGMTGTVALEVVGRGFWRRRWRVAGIWVLKRQYLLRRKRSPRKEVQLAVWAKRQGWFSRRAPLTNLPTQVALGLKMLFRQTIAATFRRSTPAHSPSIARPAPATPATLTLTSTTAATVTPATQPISDPDRDRVGAKLDSGALAAAFSSGRSGRRWRWFWQMLVSSKEVREALNCPKTSCSMGKMCGPSGRRVKLESMRRSAFSSSLKMESSCFSEPSPTSLVGSAMDLSVRLLLVLNDSVSIIAPTSEKFSTCSKCFITNRSITAAPLQKLSRDTYTSAKHAPTNYSYFSIRLNVPNAFPWNARRASSPQTGRSRMRPGSLDFWFLKKRVRTQTPSESMYLTSVGKRGRMLKLLRSAMESSSRLSSSVPIFLVHPSRKPCWSVSMTLASESTRSMTPAIMRVWKSLITQLYRTFTSCRWKSLLQAQNCSSNARQESRSVHRFMKLSSAASWCGFRLNGMISLIDSPIRLDGANPSTPGRFLEMRTILPISSSTLMKTTVVLSEKNCSLRSFWESSPTASRLHRSISFRNAWSWQNAPYTEPSRKRASPEYSFSSSIRRSSCLFSTSLSISRCTFLARICVRPSRCCRNLSSETPISAAPSRFSRKRTTSSSKATTSLELHLRAPPRFTASSSVHLDFRISISSCVRWLLLRRDSRISYLKARTYAFSPNSRTRRAPSAPSPAYPDPNASPSSPSTGPPKRSHCPLLARVSRKRRAAAMRRKRQYCWAKEATSSAQAAMSAASRVSWWVRWVRWAQKGKCRVSARRSPSSSTAMS